MNPISYFVDRYRKKKKDTFIEQVNDEVQIREKDGAIWLRFNGKNVCPMSYFNGSPVDVIVKIRALQISEHEKKNG